MLKNEYLSIFFQVKTNNDFLLDYLNFYFIVMGVKMLLEFTTRENSYAKRM